MNQSFNALIMNKENKKELYTTPQMKIVKIKTRRVVCTSPGSTGGVDSYGSPAATMGWSDDDGDNWQ